MDRGLAWLQPLEEQSSKLQWQWDSHSQHKSLHLNDPSHTSAHQTPTQLPSPRLNVEPEFERPRSREPANSSLSLQPTTSRSRIIIRRTDRRNPLDPGRGSGSLGGTINESSAIIRRIQPRSSKLLLTRRRFLLLQLLILLHKPLDLALNFANPIRKPSPANKWIGPGAAAAAVTSNTNLGLSNGNSDVASGFRSSIQNSHSRPHSREFIHEMGGSHDITDSGQETSAFIKLTKFLVPSPVNANESRRLTCLYQLQGATLYAMKLFKDEQEFYRYSPTSKQRRQFFKVPGVQCDQRTANNTGVTIHSINKQTAGLYKCQVTIEATFKSVSLERRMEVVANSSSDQSSNKQQQSAALPGGNRRGSPNQHHQHHKSSFLNQEAQSQHATNSRNPNHHSQRGLEPEASSGANLAAPESSCSLIVLIILVKSIEFLLNYDNFSRNPNH